MKERKINKKLIGVTMLIILSTIGMANANIQDVPKGFQRLSDVEIFNGTDLLSEYTVQNTLIPIGFFDELEKNLNVSKILEMKKREHNNNFNNNFSKIEKEKRTPYNADTNNSDIGPLSSGIKFAGTIYHIWNYSVSDGAALGLLVPDLDGDRLNDTLIVIYRYNVDTGIYSYTLLAKKGADGRILWQDTVSGKSTMLGFNILGDVNGDKIPDILLEIRTYDTISKKYNILLKAKDGRYGKTLWTSSINKIMWASGYSAGDLNGNGLDDIIVNMYNHDVNTQIGSYTIKAKKRK